MTARYLRPADCDRSRHWITVGNLLNIIDRFDKRLNIETDDLSNLRVSINGDPIGYIELLDGNGEFVSFMPAN